MTDEVLAVYTVGAAGFVANLIVSGVAVLLTRRANNLKDVARHEQNFALLKGSADEHWNVEITLADKR